MASSILAAYSGARGSPVSDHLLEGQIRALTRGRGQGGPLQVARTTAMLIAERTRSLSPGCYYTAVCVLDEYLSSLFCEHSTVPPGQEGRLDLTCLKSERP